MYLPEDMTTWLVPAAYMQEGRGKLQGPLSLPPLYLPGGCAGCGEHCPLPPGFPCEQVAGASPGEAVEPWGGDMGATSGLELGHTDTDGRK